MSPMEPPVAFRRLTTSPNPRATQYNPKPMQATPGPGKMSMGIPSTIRNTPITISRIRFTNVLRDIERLLRIGPPRDSLLWRRLTLRALLSQVYPYSDHLNLQRVQKHTTSTYTAF